VERDSVLAEDMLTRFGVFGGQSSSQLAERKFRHIRVYESHGNRVFSCLQPIKSAVLIPEEYIAAGE
jgi:hypothetical protein